MFIIFVKLILTLDVLKAVGESGRKDYQLI